ncbi:NUDIX hydrolase [Azospirillum sp. TSO22-1]|uniref:NUDIX domain-containing protein n=1 Tax=Azospirillum sp. TSO22-1 TaxID=716789 RepID=UPI001304B811|nr:NUDIX hydrolase [Azospirillum sp. TSO22-1]
MAIGLLISGALIYLAVAAPTYKDIFLVILGTVLSLLIPAFSVAANLFTKRARFRKILSLFEGAELTGNSDELNSYLERLFKGDSLLLSLVGLRVREPFPGIITPTRVDAADSIEAAMLLLLISKCWKKLAFSPDLKRKDIGILALRASNARSYQKILLIRSLMGLGFPRERCSTLADEIIEKHAGFIGVRLPEDAGELQLDSEANGLQQEAIWYLSATSQVSDGSRGVFERNKNGISRINFFLVSPLIISDSSLESLSIEYEVPSFAIPRDQFLYQDMEGDRLRRILKIISAIRWLRAHCDAHPDKLSVSLYSKAYPDIKVVLLQNRGYAQIKVGGLRFANNLYRFGYELRDTSILRDLVRYLENFKEEKAREVEIRGDGYYHLIDRSLIEFYWWAILHGIDRSRFGKICAQLHSKLVLQDQIYIEKLNWMYSHFFTELFNVNLFHERGVGAPYCDDHYPYLERSLADEDEPYLQIAQNGRKFHVSVGAIFTQNGKLLLIKKAKPYYQGKFSIVAGHLHQNETPLDAMRREIKEEIGIDAEKLALIRYHDLIDDTCRHEVTKHRWYVFYADGATGDIKPGDDEVADVRWFSLEEISSLDLTDVCKQILSDLGLIAAKRSPGRRSKIGGDTIHEASRAEKGLIEINHGKGNA